MTAPFDDEKMSAIYANLKALLAVCGPSRNDQFDVVVSACIDVGIKTYEHIFDTATSLGFRESQVRIRLAKGEGPNPERHRWWRDAEGIYHSHL